MLGLLSALGLFHVSLCVLGFSLGHLRVLPADSTEVWGKNTPLGPPSLNPSCRCSLQCGGGNLT